MKLIKFALVSTILLFSSCGGSNNEKTDEKEVERAKSDWAAWDLVDRTTACFLYEDFGDGKEQEFIELLTTDGGKESVSYAKEMINIMNREC